MTDSPLGARLRWPLPHSADAFIAPGEVTDGGIWFSINLTLVWALRDYRPDLSWREWNEMTLGNHQAAYPDVWTGTVSGPDAYNAPETTRPGQSWISDVGGTHQAFPVNNPHSHSQPLLGFLRLLGVEPSPDGALRIGSGATWSSQMLRIDADGHGHLLARGPATLHTSQGTVTGGLSTAAEN